MTLQNSAAVDPFSMIILRLKGSAILSPGCGGQRFKFIYVLLVCIASCNTF